MARLFLSLFAKQPCYLLFWDLKEAFYRVARPLSLDFQPTEEHVAHIFAALGTLISAYHEFLDLLTGRKALAHAGASLWLCAILREFLSNTWFRTRDQPDVVATTLGTRPGDNLADSLLHVEGPRELVCLPTEVCWMDDLCMMGTAACARDLLPLLSQVAGHLVDCCVEHGMAPNLQLAKTEALVVIKGAGAVTVRRQMLGGEDPSVGLCSRHWPSSRLRLVTCYKHLGGLLHCRSGLDKEVRVRIAMAWVSFVKYKAKVFGNAAVPLADKFPLFQSLVLSVLWCWHVGRAAGQACGSAGAGLPWYVPLHAAKALH